MTRTEFCTQMAEIRKSSSFKMKDLSVYLGMLPADIYRLEKGAHNADTMRVVKYLGFFGYHIIIDAEPNKYVISNEQQISEIMSQIRHQVGLSQRQFAGYAGLTNVMVAYIEKRHSSLKLDTLLNMCNAFNFTIQIVNK